MVWYDRERERVASSPANSFQMAPAEVAHLEGWRKLASNSSHPQVYPALRAPSPCSSLSLYSLSTCAYLSRTASRDLDHGSHCCFRFGWEAFIGFHKVLTPNAIAFWAQAVPCSKAPASWCPLNPCRQRCSAAARPGRGPWARRGVWAHKEGSFLPLHHLEMVPKSHWTL